MITLLKDWAALQAHGIFPLLAAILTILLAWRLTDAFFFSPLRNIPGPLLARLTTKRANLDTFSGNVTENVDKDVQKYGDVYVYKPRAVCINHPDDIRTVLGSQEFRKAAFFDIFNDNSTPNIVSLRDPQLASRRRRQLGPFFNYAYLGRAESLILQHGYQALQSKWNKLLEGSNGKSTEVNYRADTQLVTFDIMSALAFGRHFDSISKGSSSIMKWSGVIMSLLESPLVLGLLSLVPFSLVMRPWTIMYRELATFSRESIEMRKALLADGTAKKPSDMLQAFIDAEDPESKLPMAPHEVQAESIMMMLAGSETTSSAIMWTFHLLMLYPETLQRAVTEVRSAFAPDYLVTYKDVHARLPYIEACVFEALRQSPTTAGLTPRISHSRGITLQGHYIPPETEIYVNLRPVNMHPTLWTDPQRFNPDRFIDNEDNKRLVFTFSYGPRNCLGRNLAWVEMLTIVANVLKDYDISLPPDSEFGPHNTDENGLPVLLPSKCFIASFPARPEKDCRMLIKRAA
ncbi:cytochrome P450 monooxygenase helB1 [Aspergillus lucknowensis]|uniref:Cytochrome P450 n=1 Tax=Aspergillus lucknowensis TaxID=176173 RepID=A0ABR4LHS3_9EURO